MASDTARCASQPISDFNSLAANGRVSRTSGDLDGLPSRVRSNCCFALRLRSSDADGAAALLREGRSAAVDVGLVWAECQAEILLARCDHVRGRTASALERLEKVEDRCAANVLEHERELARGLEREIRQSLLGRLNSLSA